MPFGKRSETEISKIKALINRDYPSTTREGNVRIQEEYDEYMKLANEGLLVLADIGTGEFDTYLSQEDVQQLLEQGVDPKRKVKLFDPELIEGAGNELTLEDLVKVMDKLQLAKTTEEGVAEEEPVKGKPPVDIPKAAPAAQKPTTGALVEPRKPRIGKLAADMQKPEWMLKLRQPKGVEIESEVTISKEVPERAHAKEAPPAEIPPSGAGLIPEETLIQERPTIKAGTETPVKAKVPLTPEEQAQKQQEEVKRKAEEKARQEAIRKQKKQEIEEEKERVERYRGAETTPSKKHWARKAGFAVAGTTTAIFGGGGFAALMFPDSNGGGTAYVGDVLHHVITFFV